jgi:hypothetical protein
MGSLGRVTRRLPGVGHRRATARQRAVALEHPLNQLTPAAGASEGKRSLIHCCQSG